MLSMAEAMSVAKPDNGWFLPNCDSGVTTLLDGRNNKERRSVRVQAFNPDAKEDQAESVNVLQVRAHIL